MATDENNKASGEQTTINSGGGDVAGHDVDKRQGQVFVEGNVYGNAIGVQNIFNPPLSAPPFRPGCKLQS